MREQKQQIQEVIKKLLQAMKNTHKKILSAFATDVLQFDGAEGANFSRSQFFSRNSKVLDKYNDAQICKETLRIDVDKIREEASVFKITFCKIVGKELVNQQNFFYDSNLKAGFIDDKATQKFYTFSYNERLNRIFNVNSKQARKQQIQDVIKQKF